MYPIIFKTSFVTVYSFGLFLVLGFFAGSLITYYLSKKINSKMENLIFFDAAIFVLLAGLIGARLVFVLLNLGYFKNNLLKIITTWNSGLSLYGGLFFGILTLLFILRKEKENIFKWLDITMIGTLFGLFFGRIGSFLNGSYYGTQTNSFLGVVYKNPQSFAYAILGQKVHPIQIYEAIFALLLGGTLLFFLFRNLKNKKFSDGTIFFAGISSYAIFRYFIEFLRGNSIFIGRFNFDQVISLAVIVLIILGFSFIFLRQNKKFLNKRSLKCLMPNLLKSKKKN